MKTYDLLVSTQTSPHSPDTGHTFFQKPMQIEDAFGQIFPVPAEYNWEMLEAVVKARFSRGPGHDVVRNGNWQLSLTNDKRRCVDESWKGSFHAGLKLTMSVVVLKNDTKMRCTRPRCPSFKYFDALGGGKIYSGCFHDLTFRRTKQEELEKAPSEPKDARIILTPQSGDETHPDPLYLKNLRLAALIPKFRGVFVLSVWDFKDEWESSLILIEGDNIRVLTQLETGWWDGISNGKQ